MPEYKSFLQSKTMYGILLIVIAHLSKKYQWMPQDTNGLADDIASLIGIGIAIWGRWTATAPLSLTNPPTENKP